MTARPSFYKGDNKDKSENCDINNSTSTDGKHKSELYDKIES